MKSKMVERIIMSLILIVMLLLTTKVYATNDSFDVTLKTIDSKVNREDNIIITIGVKNIAIESGEKGIGAYTASIKFDSSVFEYISTSGTDKWEAPFYQDGLIVGNTKDGEVVKTTQDIGTITLKVKKEAKLGDTIIEVNGFSGSTVESDVVAENVSIKITVVDDNNNNNNNNENNNNENNNNDNNNNETNNDSNNSNNDSGNNSNNNSSNNNSSNNNSNIMGRPSNNNSKDSTTASGALPKTGKQSIAFMFGIGAVIVCAIFFFVKMKK